jgi:hypothetical protein
MKKISVESFPQFTFLLSLKIDPIHSFVTDNNWDTKRTVFFTEFLKVFFCTEKWEMCWSLMLSSSIFFVVEKSDLT